VALDRDRHYAELGAVRARNQSGGTDHGTSSAHFVMGRGEGGLYGAPPALDRLDGNGNLPFAVDFRSYYATCWSGGGTSIPDAYWRQFPHGAFL